MRDYRFSDSDYLKKHGLYIDRENYNRVYRGRLKPNETLEDIYERFNVNHPKDFYGHSLSVGDIVVMRKNGATTVNFVDRVGFTEVPDFTLDREERKARRTLTDNIGLIAENQLASDEMDDLGDKLFDYNNAPKYSGRASWTMGAELHADDFENLTTRYHNGENISAELAQKIYNNTSEISIYDFNSKGGYDNIRFFVNRNDIGMTFRTKGGFEITHSWETLGEALITAARKEFDRHEEIDRQYREQEEKAKSADETPYVTVSPFSNVDFTKIGLDSGKHYSIPEFNEALANADKLYTADENNAMNVDTIAVTLHFGNKEYYYLPMLGAEYGTISAIMDDISLVNSSNTFLTQQQKELVAEIEQKAQKTEVEEHSEPKAEEIKDEAQEKSATYSTTESATPPTITCEWSESAVFEEGKTYSVLEFDTLMKQADSEWIEKRQQEIDKYGNDFDKVYEAYKNGEIERVHLGYAKTKFTVNLPNGNSISERQDIGDGYGGVIDFLSQFKHYQGVAEMLQQALNAEKNVSSTNSPNSLTFSVSLWNVPNRTNQKRKKPRARHKKNVLHIAQFPPSRKSTISA